ncbi:hypothetical protein CFP56_011469 [Quercus suber]|uniref:Uncharacterized protein n=1 Tax=Quercus suber TaxID=58331 RepID=A0AAW0M406_QUESU
MESISLYVMVCGEQKVVVYEGAVREKPSSKEEALQLLKDYSGGHAATEGSVLIYFHTILDEIIEKLGTVLYGPGGLIMEHPLILPFVKQVGDGLDQNVSTINDSEKLSLVSEY